MASIFNRDSSEPYLISKLMSKFDSSGLPNGPRVIICDIDKTYIETNFESIVGIAKIAFEEAAEKQTVEGAAELLRSLYWEATEKPASIHFVSASPPQMKPVLAKKLANDRIPWQTITFKNQAYNLKKGRMSALKRHAVYKNASILSILATKPDTTTVDLIGDNAELDGFIYSGIKFLLDKTLSKEGYKEYVGLVADDPSTVSQLDEYIDTNFTAKVGGIYIRQLNNYPLNDFGPLGSDVTIFENYFTVYSQMILKGMVKADGLWQSVKIYHNIYGISQTALNRDLWNLHLHGDEETRQIAGQCIERLKNATSPEPDPLPSDAPSQPTEDQVLTAAREWLKKAKHH